jgi:hypothetical protein
VNQRPDNAAPATADNCAGERRDQPASGHDGTDAGNGEGTDASEEADIATEDCSHPGTGACTVFGLALPPHKTDIVTRNATGLKVGDDLGRIGVVIKEMGNCARSHVRAIPQFVPTLPL